MSSVQHTRSQYRDDGFHYYYFRVRHFFGGAPPLLYATFSFKTSWKYGVSAIVLSILVCKGITCLHWIASSSLESSVSPEV